MRSKAGVLLIAAVAAALCTGMFAPAPVAAQEAVYNEIVDYVNNYNKGPETWAQFLAQPGNWIIFVQDMDARYRNYLTHEQIDQFAALLRAGDETGAFTYLRSQFTFEEATPMSSPDSASNRTADTVIHEVALPSVTTRMEQRAQDEAKKEAEQSGKRFTRMVGGQIRYDWVSTGPNRDGEIPGVTVGMAQDQDRFTYGFFIPYDHLNLFEFSADRVGAVLFGQYRIPTEIPGDVSLTAHAHYLNMNPNVGNAINYFGGGVSASYTRDFDWFVPGAVITYQYTKDDSDVDYDSQHLFKLAGNVGFRIGDNAVFNTFLGWSKDASGDLPVGTDTDYWDLGLEAGYSITEAFGLTLGWRKVLALDDYESDLVYLGSSFLF